MRRRVAAVLSILLASTMLAVAFFAAGSQAAFNGQTENDSARFAFTALYAPSGLTATPSGHNVALSWTAGTNGTGYSVLGVANGTSSDCSAATYGSVGTSATTTYTDTGRYTPQGTYFCYQAKTTYGSSWTSVNSNPTAVAQIGVVASTVVRANGGTANQLGPGDTITITSNQAITTTTGPVAANSVCWTATGVVVIGAVAVSGACSATEANNCCRLTGGTTSTAGRYNATYVWSNGNKTLTVTVGSTKLAGNPATASGTFTFNPSTTATVLLSSTGAFHICDTNTGGGNCLPVSTGSF